MGILKLSDDEEQLDVKKAMVVRPAMAIELFFDHEIDYCKNGTMEMLCFQQSDYFTFSENYEIDEILGILKSLKIDENYKHRAAKIYVTYLKLKKIVQDKFEVYSKEFIIVKIKEMYTRYPSKYLDWQAMINSQLLRNSQQTLDDEILIYNPQLWKALHTLFEVFEDTLVNEFQYD